MHALTLCGFFTSVTHRRLHASSLIGQRCSSPIFVNWPDTQNLLAQTTCNLQRRSWCNDWSPDAGDCFFTISVPPVAVAALVTLGIGGSILNAAAPADCAAVLRLAWFVRCCATAVPYLPAATFGRVNEDCRWGWPRDRWGQTFNAIRCRQTHLNVIRVIISNTCTLLRKVRQPHQAVC